MSPGSLSYGMKHEPPARLTNERNNYDYSGMHDFRVNTDLFCRSANLAQKTTGPGLTRLFRIVSHVEYLMIKFKGNSFGVIARIRGLPEKADELRKRLFALAKLTQSENGCLSCEVVENGYDSTEFTLIEKWSHEKAYNVHLGTLLIKNTIKMISGLLSGELDIHKDILQLHTAVYGTNSYFVSGR